MRKTKAILEEIEAGRSDLEAGEEISCYDRIARILLCLSTGVSSVTEIARECDMKVPTVHRLLKSLVKPQFTVYDSVNHRYFLGPLIARVSSNASTNHQYLRMSSLGEMKHLAELCTETVTISVLVGNHFMSIKNIESKHELLVHELGEDLESNMTMLPFGATQKALLAQLNDKDLRNLLTSVNPQDRTRFNIDTICAEIAEIREQGFAISSDERIIGATCLACPIDFYFFPCALSILGPKSRLSRKLPALLSMLKESASRISQNIKEDKR